MSLLMDAPPVLGVLEALEALSVEELSAAQLGRAVRASGKARGRLDVVDAHFLAAFDRMGGHRPEGPRYDVVVGGGDQALGA